MSRDPHWWSFLTYSTDKGVGCDASSEFYPKEFTGHGFCLEDAVEDAARKVEAYLTELDGNEDDTPSCETYGVKPGVDFPATMGAMR